MAQIEVKNVYKIFGNDPKKILPKVQEGATKEEILEKTGHTVGLDNVSISVEEGETFVCMGLSGSGKSTLIRHINRLIDPTSGEVLVEGTNVMSLTEINKTSMEKIEAVGLIGFENQYPNQLSGGMQQRVGLARALATNTNIMLMDEAFSALDPLIRSDMQKQLLALQSELKKTILFITHDLDESLKLGDHIGILNAGKLVQVGTPIDIIMNPADDYVAAFVKDVNRAKVIKAKVIMIPANQFNGSKNLNMIKINEDSFLDEFLSKICLTAATVEVVDKNGNVKGYITDKELSKALTKTQSNGKISSQKK